MHPLLLKQSSGLWMQVLNESENRK